MVEGDVFVLTYNSVVSLSDTSLDSVQIALIFSVQHSGVRSPQLPTSACPRQSPDSGIAMSTDSSSFSPQSLVEKKRSSSLSELSGPVAKLSSVVDERPNSANAVLNKVPTSGPFSSSSTVPLNHDPSKPVSRINQLPLPPPLGQVAYNSTYYPGCGNYNAYGVCSTSVYTTPTYSSYSSTTSSAGPSYYPSSGTTGSSNLYSSNSPYTYLPQRNTLNSYVPLTYYPTTTATNSSSSPLSYADISSSSTVAVSSNTEPSLDESEAAAHSLLPVHTPPCVQNNSPTKPLSSSQSLPDDEAHMSPDSSFPHFPVITLPDNSSSAESEMVNHSCSDQEESDEKRCECVTVIKIHPLIIT